MYGNQKKLKFKEKGKVKVRKYLVIIAQISGALNFVVQIIAWTKNAHLQMYCPLGINVRSTRLFRNKELWILERWSRSNIEEQAILCRFSIPASSPILSLLDNFPTNYLSGTDCGVPKWFTTDSLFPTQPTSSCLTKIWKHRRRRRRLC